jgi:hypothetical protein
MYPMYQGLAWTRIWDPGCLDVCHIVWSLAYHRGTLPAMLTHLISVANVSGIGLTDQVCEHDSKWMGIGVARGPVVSLSQAAGISG